MILLIDIFAVCLYIGILTGIDIHRKAKGTTRRVLQFYFLGLLSIPFVYLMDGFTYSVRGFLWADSYYIDAFIHHFFFVGPLEEFSKFFIFFAFSRLLKSIKEPRDGLLQAAAVALAFASIENLIYGMEYGVGVMIERTLLTLAGHMVYSSVWGFAVTVVVYRDIRKAGRLQYGFVFAALFTAAFIHGLYNFLLALDLFLLAVLLDVLALGFAVLVFKLMMDDSPYRKYPLKDYRKALKAIRLGLLSNPRNFALNMRAGVYHLYSGDYREALKYFELCLKLRPANPYARFYTGIVLLIFGEEGKGRNLLREGLFDMTAKGRERLYEWVESILPNPLLGRILRGEFDSYEEQQLMYGRDEQAPAVGQDLPNGRPRPKIKIVAVGRSPADRWHRSGAGRP